MDNKINAWLEDILRSIDEIFDFLPEKRALRIGLQPACRAVSGGSLKKKLTMLKVMSLPQTPSFYKTINFEEKTVRRH
ncbi:MAG: hypothetical protein K0B09_04175 [Bacteroidales bacterium]|nr:hypothetical protein [Bacteroidales bacterium]